MHIPLQFRRPSVRLVPLIAFLTLAALVGLCVGFAVAHAEHSEHSAREFEQPVEVLADPSGNLDVQQAASGIYKPVKASDELAADSSAFWARIQVRPSGNRQTKRVLTIEPGWDVVDLYMPGDRGFDHLRSGNSIPPLHRPIHAHYIAFPVSIPANSESVLYVRVHNVKETSAAARHLRFFLIPPDVFVGDVRTFNYKHGIYAGIILTMVAYNFVLFFSLRERTYLFYSIYVLAFGMLWMQRSEFLYDYLWPNNSYWNWSISFYLVGIAVIFSALFVRSFFDTQDHSRALNATLWAIVCLTALLLIGGLTISPQKMASFLAWDSLATTVFYGGLGLYMLLRGHQRARYFLLAWATLLATNVFYILVFLGIAHSSALTAEDAVQVGSAAECILLAFALADRVRDMKAEKEEQQRQHTAILEEAVAQRTRELMSLNARLEAASITDPLTGLSNRRMLDVTMNRLTTEVHRAVRNGESDSLLVCIADLDYFKTINDNYGHETGDEALKQVASTLSSAIRATTILARWGGEEFLLVDRLRQRDEDTRFAERIRQLIAEDVCIRVSGGEERLTMSLGLAHFPFSTAYPDLLTWQEVLILADRCLYQAKDAGRNCWFIVRVNEDGLECYIREHGVAAATTLCRSRFDEAIALGVLEIVSAHAECS